MSDDASSGEAPGPARPGEGEVPSARNSVLVGAGIFLSRITGLLRERAIGHFFGTGFAADAFTAAFRIPNLLQNLLGEGVLSASFIPVYSKLLADGRREEAAKVAGAVLGLLMAVAGGLVLLGVVLARPLAGAVAPGLTGATFELTVTLMRIIFPGIGFLVLSAWCLGVLNSHRRFFLSYVAPVIWNVAQIAVLVGLGLTLFAGEFRVGAEEATAAAQSRLVVWLAWGTVVGGLLQFLVQLPGVLRATRGLRPSLRRDVPGVRRVIRAFGPIVAGRGVVQLSAYVDIFLASFLAVGALAALRYGQMLYLLPISLFGMAVAAAELPELSSLRGEDREHLTERLDAGMARIAFFVAPTAIAYLLIGDLLVGTVFQTGEFDALVTLQVWVVLACYAVGLLASTASRLLQSALYGIGDPRTPAKVAALRVVISVVLGLALMFQLDRVAVTGDGLVLVESLPALGPLPESVRAADVTGMKRIGAAGLAIAAGLASWVEYWLLRRRVAREIGRTRVGGGRLRRMLLPLGLVASACLAVRPLVAGLHPLLAGTGAALVVGAVYLVSSRVAGVPEANELGDLARRVLRR